MRLQLEAREAELGAAAASLTSSMLALDEVRRDVDVHVEAAAHELARAGARRVVADPALTRPIVVSGGESSDDVRADRHAVAMN